MASSVSLAAAYRRGAGSTPQLSTPRYHPAPSRNEVSAVQPVLVHYRLLLRLRVLTERVSLR